MKLLDISKVDLTNNNQKIFAGVLIVAFLIVFFWLLPTLTYLFANLWLLVILAAPFVYAAFNPMQVWNWFKQMSWALTKWSVSKDKLGYMYRYHEYLLLKLERLGESVQNVSAARVKMQRKITELIS